MGKGFKSLQGQLLLDGGNLRHSFFHRSVVLVCQHDAEGAFGLVLNRTSDALVGNTLSGQLPETLKDQTLFLGGPVQPAALSFLHADEVLLEANVMANLKLGHSMDELLELGLSLSSSQRLRVFAGYSGWGAGQLDSEMKRQAWVTYPASLELIFHSNPASLWQQILRRMGWQYRLLAEQPDDLAWN